MTGTAGTALIPERLGTGTSGTVLIADFQPFSSGKRLGELVAEGAPEQTVLQIEPARDLTGRLDCRTLDELAGGYLASMSAVDALSDHPPVTTVVGYCSAAVLAVRIARLLPDGNARVLLLRPSWPDPAMLSRVLAEIRGQLAVPGAAQPEADFEPAGDPQAALVAVSEVVHGDLRALAASHGVDSTSRPLVELLERYQGWFGYLLAARQAVERLRAEPPVSLPAEVLVLTDSAEQTTVPGLVAGSYRHRPLPLGAAKAPAELAREVLSELATAPLQAG